MRRAVMCMIAFLGICQDSCHAETELSILTWNIQFLPAMAALSDSLDKMQAERLPWIIEFLNNQDYDVLCLQEVFDQQLSPKLIEGLKSKYPHVVMPQFHTEGRLLSNGVLFMSRVPIKYVAHVTFTGLEDEEVVTSKGCCLIEGEKDGVRFQLAGTHYPTGKQTIKDQATRDIHDNLLAPNSCKGIPVFLAGDLNTATTQPEFKSLLQLLGLTEFPINDPRPYSADNDNSWRPGKKAQHIDHVLLNPNGTASTITSQTINRPRREHNGKPIDLADHYGVAARATIQN
ncbi:MAG TPA: endonuclease/exonuclease/phosphatase family protein [Candidatus Bathyarchaeia archaeon]|nr:endonuclease/exonuclease/phosphatase family protein [Candidatus Bathyarchaeia archaeon]